MELSRRSFVAGAAASAAIAATAAPLAASADEAAAPVRWFLTHKEEHEHGTFSP